MCATITADTAPAGRREHGLLALVQLAERRVQRARELVVCRAQVHTDASVVLPRFAPTYPMRYGHSDAELAHSAAPRGQGARCGAQHTGRRRRRRRSGAGRVSMEGEPSEVDEAAKRVGKPTEQLVAREVQVLETVPSAAGGMHSYITVYRDCVRARMRVRVSVYVYSIRSSAECAPQARQSPWGRDRRARSAGARDCAGFARG